MRTSFLKLALMGRSPGAFYRTPRVQRGTLAGGGGRHTRQSDLRSAVLGRRARCQAVSIWALLLLAAYDLQFVRGRRIFPFSGIGDIVDWAAIVARWQPAWAWRVALIAPGTATYFFLWVPLCAWNTRASDQKSQRSSTQPERTNCPCGPNRGQKRTAIPTHLQIHERLFNILRELSIGSSSGRIDDHRTADDFN